MNPPIPPGIAMPDEGQTRLASLTFCDCFPDARTAAGIDGNQARSMLQTDQDCPQVGSLKEGWNMLFRLYAPLDPGFDKTWTLSEIERLD